MNAVAHRGPDGRGEYLSSEISLGHTRLAILDISKRGKQPMFSPDQNVVCIFNGEIYNFKELRSMYLNEYIFHSNSDAEVIPYLYEKFGIDFVQKLRGVFAIAIYDKRSKLLYLIRDRFGVKPLYYTFQNNTCFFGLPGNPISTAACFRFFVLPLLFKSLGLEPEKPIIAKLKKTLHFGFYHRTLF